jgi:hypothetical protein
MRVVKSFNSACVYRKESLPAKPSFSGLPLFGFLPPDLTAANEGISEFQQSIYSLFIGKMLDLSYLHRNHLP